MSELKKKILMIVGGVWGVSIVLIVLFYFALVMPSNSKLAKLDKQIKQLTEHSDAHYASLAERTKVSKKRLEDIRSQVSGFMIETEKWVSMMSYISDVFDGIGIKEFSSKDTTGREIMKVAGCKKLGFKGIKVKFNSDYCKFAKFINSLESGRPVVFIDKFSIKKQSQKQETSSIDMHLLVLIDTTGVISEPMTAMDNSITVSEQESQIR